MDVSITEVRDRHYTIIMPFPPLATPPFTLIGGPQDQLCIKVSALLSWRSMLANPPKVEDLKVYTQASDFFASCASYLCAREAENNLILGIGAALGTPSSPYKDFFLASVGAPQVDGAFLMTPPHNLIISASASARSIASVVAYFQTTGRSLPGVLGPASAADLFAGMWEEKSGERADLTTELLCYRLSAVQSVPRANGSCRKATSADLDLLAAWSRQFDIDAHAHRRDDSLIRRVLETGIAEGQFYIWEDGVPVSMARASGATPSGTRIAAVYTPGEHRGLGYASSLVADVSQVQLNSGKRFCFLFTDAANATTNKIYRHIGYEHVGDFHEQTFSRR